MEINENPIMRVFETEVDNLLVFILIHLNALVKYLLELTFSQIER